MNRSKKYTRVGLKRLCDTYIPYICTYYNLQLDWLLILHIFNTEG